MRHDEPETMCSLEWCGTRAPQGMAGRLRSRMERPGMRLPATHHRKPISGGQMTNTEKTIICTVITCMLIIFLTIGTCIFMQWYTATHHDFQMETVKTGDVTWACLKDRGTYIGCNAVEEYK